MTDTAAGPSSNLRERNRLRIVDELRRAGRCSRADLVRSTGLSRTTVSKLVGELQADGIVVERRDDEAATGGGVGRPPVALALAPAAGGAIGVDFGHDIVQVAVADLSGGVLAEARRAFDVDHDAAASIDVAIELIEELLDRAGLTLERIVGIGVAVSAPILRHPEGARILPGWAAFAPVDELQRRLGRPVLMDNDANLGALAEVRHGAGVGCTDVLYLMLSAGIGAGLVADGRLIRGRHGITGEIGHVVVDPKGAICRCGNRGCLETIAAAPALLGTLAPLRGPDITLDQLVALARNGDEGCRRLIADAGHAVGQAAGALCNVLDPELIIVGGSMIVAGDELVAAVRAGHARAVMPAIREHATVVPATLGDRAEVLGAVGLVLEETDTTAAFV
jgi:predicted NBD/HSP70 family sugar kinase